jgi:hypothetical protein
VKALTVQCPQHAVVLVSGLLFFAAIVVIFFEDSIDSKSLVTLIPDGRLFCLGDRVENVN